MRLFRAVVLIGLIAIVAYVAYRTFGHAPSVSPATVTVYYTKADGQTVQPWPVTLGPARDRNSIAFYAAVQAVAGPSASIEAVRFPSGTKVNRVTVAGKTAVVDLGGSIAAASGEAGTFAESGEFKSLVWTLTALPEVTSVRVLVNGSARRHLTRGHLELDEPLSRSKSW